MQAHKIKHVCILAIFSLLISKIVADIFEFTGEYIGESIGQQSPSSGDDSPGSLIFEDPGVQINYITEIDTSYFVNKDPHISNCYRIELPSGFSVVKITHRRSDHGNSLAQITGVEQAEVDDLVGGESADDPYVAFLNGGDSDAYDPDVLVEQMQLFDSSDCTGKYDLLGLTTEHPEVSSSINLKELDVSTLDNPPQYIDLTTKYRSFRLYDIFGMVDTLYVPGQTDMIKYHLFMEGNKVKILNNPTEALIEDSLPEVDTENTDIVDRKIVDYTNENMNGFRDIRDSY